MLDLGKKNILGVLVNAIDYDSAVSRIIAAAKSRTPLTVSALAVHGIMTGVLDKIHRYRLNHFDLILPDGQPVRWALNLLFQTGLVERVYGPTLMLKICEQAAEQGLPVFLYGTRNPILERLRRNLCLRFPGLTIAGQEPSQFRQISEQEKLAVVESILASGAAITFVGLGCPKQEVWIYEYRQLLNMPLIAVGAAFEFHAGTNPQASPTLQKYGLEWLFRLIREPRRLWKRYILLNPAYLAMIALQALHVYELDPSHSTAPLEELRYG